MSDFFVNNTLLPHLLDIASDPASEGLILAGGLGIQMKRQHLYDTNAETLISISELPDVRPTVDIDLFLRMELFVQKERGRAVRAMLENLDYKEYTPQWQFGKSLGPQFSAERKVKVDLLARSPRANELVKSDERRVGSKSGTEIHGRNTPEAFAVEDHPLRIDFSGTRTNGAYTQTSIFVAHPYAWINMKIKAAYDWLTATVPKNNSARHAFDVYMLTAMLTSREIEEAKVLAQEYTDHPIAREIKVYAQELYALRTAPGFIEAKRQAGKNDDEKEVQEEHAVLWEGLCQVLSISL